MDTRTRSQAASAVEAAPLLVAEPASADVESRGEAMEDTLRGITPWMVSLLAHLAIIVIALFLVWSTIVVWETDEQRRPVTLREHKAEHDTLSESDEPQLKDESSRAAPQSEKLPDRPDFRPVVAPVEPIGIGQLTPSPVTPIDGWSRTNDTGKSMFPTTGLGDGDDVGGPRGGSAKRIVFVIDASGSLIGELDFVVRQLKDTIQQLGEKQQFTVIFFQRDFAMEAAGRGMRYATEEHKQKVQEWISPGAGYVVPGGSSNPLAAMKLAFAYKPDLVYILSDNITGSGVYQVDRAALLAQVAELNRAKARVHTIQFLYPDPQHTLKDIAESTGGEHRLITEADLLGRDSVTRRRGPGA